MIIRSTISRVFAVGTMAALGAALSGCATSPMQTTLAQNAERSEIEYRLWRDNYDSHTLDMRQSRPAPAPKQQQATTRR